MNFNINTLAKAYDKYREAPNQNYIPETTVKNNKLVQVKGKQWLGKKWVHADGSVTNKSCVSILLSKWCVTRSLYKRITKTDIKAVYINACAALNESNSKQFETQEDKIAFCEREVALYKAIELVICFDLYQRHSKMLDLKFKPIEQKFHDNRTLTENTKYSAMELLETVKKNPNDPLIPELLEKLAAEKKKILL